MKIARAGILKRIHINGALLREKRTGRKAVRPVAIHSVDGTINCSEVVICGPSRLVFRPDRPLPSGAKVWVETRHEVRYA